MVNPKSLANEVLGAIRAVHGHRGPLALHKPFTNADDAAMVHHAAMTQPVGYGYIEDFEAELSLQTGARHAVAVSSGTAALHLALKALGVSGGYIVAVPPLTFAGAAAAVCYCGANPIFTDEAPIEAAAQIKVDLLGRLEPSLVGAMVPVSIIEDAAAALGSRGLFGRMAGTMGTIGVLSFNNNKIVTTGGGGAVLTDSGELAMKVRHLATTAKIDAPFRFEHDAVGYNYRLGNINAALGLSQLLRLPATLMAKRKLHEAYQEAFGQIEEVTLDVPDPGTRPNHWLNSIIVPTGYRDTIMETLLEDDVQSRALFTPLPMLAPYKDFPADASAVVRAMGRFETTVLIPSGAMS